MADLQEQLQAILGNPEAMGQITAIAKALTGGGPQPQADPAPETPGAVQDVDYIPVEDETPPAPGSPGGGDVPDLSALLSLLGGGNAPQIDPKLIRIALRVYSEYSAQDDEKVALLNSLKPFLREERREKLEKAAGIARLSRVVRVALQLLREEGSEDV
ncbi:MAG: hypothetical protein MR272_07095 [Pseudoflavonifractor sp.]|nr:hypothetical protein [Pseudoflavonifractor sp.]MDY3019625.1 hypothetical protein [Oscillospiraceae bacterium]